MAQTKDISNVQNENLRFVRNNNTDEDAEHESGLQLLQNRRLAEEKKKAQKHWTLLRDSIQNVRRAVENENAREIGLVHGILYERKLNHINTVQWTIFISQEKEYLTCDGETVFQFFEDGKKKNETTLDEHMNRIVFASQTRQFVGWVHKEDTLYLMNENFEVKSQSQTVGSIYLGAYNHNTGEIITAGPGFFTCWVFRYGARHLIPRKTVVMEQTEGKAHSFMVLEDTASHSQRIFFACGNGVVVYNIFEGKLIDHRKDLHVRPLTALTFFNPLKYLITGAMDGCIKVWDEEWNVTMVFVGHSGAVSSLAIYPHGPQFMSASDDCTIRVWSLETCDEVDKTSITEPVAGLGTTAGYDLFFSYAGKKVDLWRLSHLYQIHTNVGYRVQKMKLTTHPFYPTRAILLCRDSSVRIVSPPVGEVITTLIMPSSTGLIDAAYAVADNTMFTVCGNGDIVKCRTDVNPCEVQARWRCPSMKEMCNCLMVYEYVVDVGAGDGHAVSKRKKTESGRPGGGSTYNRNRTLLFGGRKDGYLSVYSWDTGDVDFRVEAHGNNGVLSMVSNSKLDQLISAGMDNIIKVWRVYPFAQESLVPLMSFYCGHTAVAMATIRSSLCVAFQDPATATFSVVLYNLPEKKKDEHFEEFFSEKNRHDHKPDDDHADLITGLTSCSRMKLFASSSVDGTIRIWSDDNKLVRLLKLNAVPNSIGFCSSRGDLLVGIGMHLYHIPYQRYLPKPYLRKMVSMRFLEPHSEEPVPFSEGHLAALDKNDVKRLKSSHASFKVVHYEDELTEEEADEVMHEKKIKEKAFSELEIRENEMLLIRDGAKTSSKKTKSTKRTQREALKRYMKMFYNKERIKVPPDDPFPEDTLREKLDVKVEEKEDVYKPETAPTTFLQEIARNRTPGSITHGCGVGPMGFVPNSVLVKLLYPPPPPPPDPAALRPYRPPELTRKQLSEIRALRKIREPSPPPRSVSFADREESFDLSKRTLELDLDEELDNTAEDELEGEKSLDLSVKEGSELELKSETLTPVGEEKKVPKPVAPSPVPLTFPPLAPRALLKKKATIEEEEEDEDKDDELQGTQSKQKTDLMSKFKDILEKSAPPKAEETEEEGESPVLEDKAVQTLAQEKPKSAALKEVQQPRQPIRKLVSRPKTKVSTSPPPKSPSPPPPPTPLPNFIRQFVGQEWFEHYFPNCNETTMPKPWSGDNFVHMIMKLLRFASFAHKKDVAEAMAIVHKQEILLDNTRQAAQKMLLMSLNHHANTPSCAVPEQKEFILAAVRSLQVMGIFDKEFVQEMLVQLLDGDREVRSTVTDILSTIGLQDPHKQLQKELDVWDIWNVDEAERKKDLLRMCGQWLDRWMTSYKLHIQDAVEHLQKGQNLHGRLPRGSLTSRHQTSSKADSLPPIIDLGGGGDTPRSSTHGSLTLTIKQPDMSLSEQATYMEALNYFCEMMTEKELEAIRRGETLRRGPQDNKAEQTKNTVLVLPRITHKPALVRLGDTHTSKLSHSHHNSLNAELAQMLMLGKGRQPVPGTLSGFVPCINLPMKAVYLNPFPSPIDTFDRRFADPILITLKSSQKYFIPAASVVPAELQW